MKAMPAAVAALAACLSIASPGVAQNPRPDLVISGMTASATTAVIGDSITYTVTAANIGGLPCNLIKLQLNFPDTLELTAARVSSPLSCDRMICTGGSFFLLWGGQSFAATYTLKALANGVHAVSATIDPDNVCSENKESNNVGNAPPLTVAPPPPPPPRLTLTAGPPSNRTTREQTAQMFPLTIKNIGDGPAVNIALQWSANLGDLGPTLMSVQTGHPAVSRPFDCNPAGSNPRICTIRTTLQPQQTVQANVRFAACINGVNAEIKVSTAGDVFQDNHSVRLNDTCPRPDLAVSAQSVPPPVSSLQPTQIFPLTITNAGQGPAVDVALSWSNSIASVGPTLVSAYLGPRVAAGQPPPPLLSFQCQPPGTPTLCTIPVLLQPGQMIQADVRFATCRDRRLNATVMASTPGDTRTDNQSTILHANCLP